MTQKTIISLLFATYVAAVLVPFSYVRFMTPPALQVESSLGWFYVAYALISVLVLGVIGILIQDAPLQQVSFLNLMIGGAGFLGSSLLYATERAWLSDPSSARLLVAVSVIFSVTFAQIIATMVKHVLSNKRVGSTLISIDYSSQPSPKSTVSETLVASMFGVLMLVPAYAHVLLVNKFSWITFLSSAGLSVLGVIVSTWVIWKIEQSEKKNRGNIS